MKTLYLIRHAKSSWEFPELPDKERPLNKRGKRDAPDMGGRLANKGFFPDLMLSSPAKRALRTCEIIADKLKYPEGAIETNSKIYHAGSQKLLEVVKSIDDAWNVVCLFGHNPGFTDFANALSGTNIDNIPTCGIFACEFDTGTWAKVDYGMGKQVFYDYPKSNR